VRTGAGFIVNADLSFVPAKNSILLKEFSVPAPIEKTDPSVDKSALKYPPTNKFISDLSAASIIIMAESVDVPTPT
jgi:hypothetical protein